MTAAAMRAAGLGASLSSPTPEAVAEGGTCLRLRNAAGEAVMVLRVDGPVLWVDGLAAAVPGAGIADDCFALVEGIARRAGCTAVAFETARPGLVRKARKNGYAPAAFIMKRNLA